MTPRRQRSASSWSWSKYVLSMDGLYPAYYFLITQAAAELARLNQVAKEQSASAAFTRRISTPAFDPVRCGDGRKASTHQRQMMSKKEEERAKKEAEAKKIADEKAAKVKAEADKKAKEEDDKKKAELAKKKMAAFLSK